METEKFLQISGAADGAQPGCPTQTDVTDEMAGTEVSVEAPETTSEEVSVMTSVEVPGANSGSTEAEDERTAVAEAAGEAVAEGQRYSEAEVQQMLADAEQRGYLRGCNEQIDKLMEAPRLYEQQGERRVEGEKGSEILILNNMRRSVWE